MWWIVTTQRYTIMCACFQPSMLCTLLFLLWSTHIFSSHNIQALTNALIICLTRTFQFNIINFHYNKYIHICVEYMYYHVLFMYVLSHITVSLIITFKLVEWTFNVSVLNLSWSRRQDLIHGSRRINQSESHFYLTNSFHGIYFFHRKQEHYFLHPFQAIRSQESQKEAY